MGVKKDEWFKSKRLYAAAVLIIATILAGFGVEVDAETQQVVVNNLTAIGVAVAALVSVVLDIWSKWKEREK